MAIEIARTRNTIITNIRDLATDKVYNDPKEIADCFANYFMQVPHNVRKKMPSKIPDLLIIYQKLSGNQCSSNTLLPWKFLV